MNQIQSMGELQLSFGSLLPINPVNTSADNATRFADFHAANPHVYGLLRSLALQLRAQGYQKYGMKALFEILRWQSRLQTNGDAFKLNNIYTAYYARLLMSNEPVLAGFFETREQE